MTFYDFYKDRINSSYQDYFNDRYEPFLRKIKALEPRLVIEEGMGIGSVSKSLISANFECFGYDIEDKMVTLAKRNNPTLHVWQDDIFKFNPKFPEDVLLVTHGVLEHFSDEQILAYFKARESNQSIHYVPLNKYKEQSFGDERLMPHTFWTEISGSDNWGLFNDCHDFWFYVDNKKI